MGPLAPTLRIMNGLMAFGGAAADGFCAPPVPRSLPPAFCGGYLRPQAKRKIDPWARASEPEARSTLLRPLEPGIIRSPERVGTGWRPFAEMPQTRC